MNMRQNKRAAATFAGLGGASAQATVVSGDAVLVSWFEFELTV